MALVDFSAEIIISWTPSTPSCEDTSIGYALKYMHVHEEINFSVWTLSSTKYEHSRRIADIIRRLLEGNK
jgi:methionine synthase II (cobalamin-independent)